MKNIPIFLVLFVNLFCEAQPHVSELFSIDTTVTLEYYTKVGQQREIVGTVFEDNFYFCKKCISEEDAFVLKLYCVDMKRYKQTLFNLQLVDIRHYDKNGANKTKIWVKGIAVSDDRIAVITQNKLFVFSCFKNFGESDKEITVKNAVDGYFHQGIFYVIEMDNHEKYVLSSVDGTDGTKKHIRDFCFDAPFVLQFRPNRYLVVSDDGICHLETNNIGYTKYSLEGDTIYTARCETDSLWKSIPPEVTKKIMSHPYGTGRIYEALESNRENSFCTKIFPLKGNRSLIAYRCFDIEEQKEAYRLVYTCYDSLSQKLETKPYRFDYYDDELLSNENFPFYLYKSEVVYSQTYSDKFIQIVQNAPLDWSGLSAGAYKDSVNKYYKDHEPVIQLRIMTLRGGRVENGSALTNISSFCDGKPNFLFKDFEGNFVNIDSLPNSKMIIIVNNELQCSSCEHVLYDFFNGVVMENDCIDGRFVVAVAFPELCSFLLKRERIKEVAQYVKIPFTPLFFDNMVLPDGCDFISASDFPKVILLNKTQNGYMSFDSSDIFNDNSCQNVIDDNFREKVLHFLRE